MSDLRDGEWLNAPAQSRLSNDDLQVVTDARTDFRREMHYGFTRDNGHFLGVATSDGFAAEVRVEAMFEHLYDPAGIMVRADERHWIEAGLEFSVGHALLGSVLTDELSAR